YVDLLAEADNFRGKNASMRAQQREGLRHFRGRRRQKYPHAIRALHHVIVGNDVAVGFDDDSSAEAAFAAHGARSARIIFVRGSISSDHDFHNGWRYAF